MFTVSPFVINSDLGEPAGLHPTASVLQRTHTGSLNERCAQEQDCSFSSEPNGGDVIEPRLSQIQTQHITFSATLPVCAGWRVNVSVLARQQRTESRRADPQTSLCDASVSTVPIIHKTAIYNTALSIGENGWLGWREGAEGGWDGTAGGPQ